MLIDYIEKVKKLLISNKLWNEKFTILLNSKNGGQSLCFFIRDENNKPKYIAKYFDYLKDLGNITNMFAIGNCENVDQYLDILSDNQIPYDIEIIKDVKQQEVNCKGRIGYNPYNLFATIVYCFSKFKGTLRDIEDKCMFDMRVNLLK